MYKILRSKSFRKSVKKIEKSGNKNNFRKLENIIYKLCEKKEKEEKGNKKAKKCK